MAVVILHAESEEPEAEVLARACERRGLFLELETGARPGRPWRPDDVCVALLGPDWPLRAGAQQRLRRGFDASLEARLAPALLDGAIAPFGWRDLAPAPAGAGLAEMLLHAAPGAPASPTAVAQDAPARRQVLLLCSRTGAGEAEDLRASLEQAGTPVQVLGPDAPGAQARAALAQARACVLLLDGEAAESDGMRRWVHLLQRVRAPWLAAARDGLWREKPLAAHLRGVRQVELGRLAGGARPAALRRALARLPAPASGRGAAR